MAEKQTKILDDSFVPAGYQPEVKARQTSPLISDAERARVDRLIESGGKIDRSAGLAVQKVLREAGDKYPLGFPEDSLASLSRAETEKNIEAVRKELVPETVDSEPEKFHARIMPAPANLKAPKQALNVPPAEVVAPSSTGIVSKLRQWLGW
jgi:hypothetical protein